MQHAVVKLKGWLQAAVQSGQDLVRNAGLTGYFDTVSTEFDRLDGSGQAGQLHPSRRRAIFLREVHAVAAPEAGEWLDAGCGAGQLSCELSVLGYDVVGVDASDRMRALATQRAASPDEREEAVQCAMALGIVSPPAVDRGGRVTIEHANLDDTLSFADGRFAGIVCSGVVEYLASPAFTLAELARVLRPGGYLIVSFNNTISPFRWLSGPAKRGVARLLGRHRDVLEVYHNRPYTIRNARRLLERAGLSDVRWRRHTYAAYVRGDMWLPPRELAERLEALEGVPVVRDLAWGLVAIARKP